MLEIKEGHTTSTRVTKSIVRDLAIAGSFVRSVRTMAILTFPNRYRVIGCHSMLLRRQARKDRHALTLVFRRVSAPLVGVRRTEHPVCRCGHALVPMSLRLDRRAALQEHALLSPTATSSPVTAVARTLRKPAVPGQKCHVHLSHGVARRVASYSEESHPRGCCVARRDRSSGRHNRPAAAGMGLAGNMGLGRCSPVAGHARAWLRATDSMTTTRRKPP